MAFTDAATELVGAEKEHLSRYLLTLKPSVRRNLAENAGNLHMLGVKIQSSAGRLVQHESGILGAVGTLMKQALQ